MGGYIVEISLDEILGRKSKLWKWLGDGGLWHQQVYWRCRGYRVRFYTKHGNSQSIIGIPSVQDGEFINGKRLPGRRLNGDVSDQGRSRRSPLRMLGIQKCPVYS